MYIDTQTRDTSVAMWHQTNGSPFVRRLRRAWDGKLLESSVGLALSLMVPNLCSLERKKMSTQNSGKKESRNGLGYQTAISAERDSRALSGTCKHS
jgi:hypothetical protein